jgi:hypothetical protein
MIATQQFNIDETMSLFIPHVFPNFDESYIAEVFEGLDFGSVHNVDLVAKMDRNGNTFNAAFVHFYKWTNSSMVENFQDRVKNPEKDARIMHDDPWFWIVLENKAKKYIPGERKQRINITDDAMVIDLENPEYLEGEYNEGNDTNVYYGDCEEEDDPMCVDLLSELAELREKNLELCDIIEKKNETITMLEHDFEALNLDYQESHWQEVNVQITNCELENKYFEMKDQLQAEQNISCTISQQYEAAVNEIRRLKSSEHRLSEDLESANDRGIEFAEKYCSARHELETSEETLAVFLDGLKTATDLESLKEMVKQHFDEMNEQAEWYE